MVDRLCRTLGENLPLSTLTAEQVAHVFALAWGTAAARTWNRHRAAIRSFGAWAALDDLAAALDRRAEVSLPPPEFDLETLWTRDLPLREHTLWRMLNE